MLALALCTSLCMQGVVVLTVARRAHQRSDHPGDPIAAEGAR